MTASLYYSLVTNTVVAIGTRENVAWPLLHSLLCVNSCIHNSCRSGGPEIPALWALPCQ